MLMCLIWASFVKYVSIFNEVLSCRVSYRVAVSNTALTLSICDRLALDIVHTTITTWLHTMCTMCTITYPKGHSLRWINLTDPHDVKLTCCLTYIFVTAVFFVGKACRPPQSLFIHALDLTSNDYFLIY